jgi:hypothetical protein
MPGYAYPPSVVVGSSVIVTINSQTMNLQDGMNYMMSELDTSTTDSSTALAASSDALSRVTLVEGITLIGL